MRLWWRRRRLGYRACGVPTCPHERVGAAAWCRDHTDSIWAEPFPDGDPIGFGTKRHEAAVRLGARRWALRAEVDAELERRHAEVLQRILEMSPVERALPMNRACWDHGSVKLAARVEELTELGLCEPPAQCPAGSWSRDGGRRCKLLMYHHGPHEYERVAIGA